MGEGTQGLDFSYVEARRCASGLRPLMSLWLDLLVLRLMNEGRTAERSRYGSCWTNWPACKGCRS